MKSGRRLENWSQKVSQTLKAWVLSQIKPLISHLNKISESYDAKIIYEFSTPLIRFVHFRPNFLDSHLTLFKIDFSFSDISTFQNWNTRSIHTNRRWTNYSNPGQLYPPCPPNFKVVFSFQGLRRVDKTNQTPLHDTSRTRCLTWTFGAGGVSPIFSSRFEYFVHLRYIYQTSRLEKTDSPKISFLKLMCFYSLKIYISIFDHPNPTFFQKNIAILFVHVSSQFCFGVLTCLLPMLSIPCLISISQFWFLLW